MATQLHPSGVVGARDSQAHGNLHPRVQAVGPEHFGIVCRRLRQGPVQVDARRLLRQSPRPPHRRRAQSRGLPGRDPGGPRGRSAASPRRLSSPWSGPGDTTSPVQAGLRRRPASRSASSTPSPPSSSASPPTPATRPTTPTSPPSTAPRSTASACSSPSPTPSTLRLQLLARHRRDLVRKSVGPAEPDPRTSQLLMPGYAACFDDVFDQQHCRSGSPGTRLGRRDPPAGHGRPARELRRGGHAHPRPRPWRGSSPGPRRRPDGQEPADTSSTAS